MKKIFPLSLLLVYVLASAQQSSAQRSIPFVTAVDPLVAPSGAVIQLKIQSDTSVLNKYRLAIGGVTARFYQTDKNDPNSIAAIVPYNISKAAPGKSTPVDIVFFDPEEHGGIVFNQFSVLVPSGLTGKEVEIDGVKTLDFINRVYDVTFNDYIPVELWPKVKIYFNNKEVEKVFKMNERAFTVELPTGVSTDGFNAFVRVGDKESSTHPFGSFAASPSSTLATSTPTPEPDKSGWTSILPSNVILVLAVGLGIVGYQFIQSRFKAKPAAVEAPERNEVLTLSDLPSDLVEACAAGECVLYAGAGLSARCGFPVWKEFVLGLLDWAHHSGFISEAETVSYRAEIERGQADSVADSLVSRFNTIDQQIALNNYLRSIFLKRARPSSLHSQLKEINFSAVLTTNFDNLLENVYEAKLDQVFIPSDTESLLASLTRRAFFILKLYGTLDDQETVMIAPAQYENAITGNALFSEFMQTLFFSRTLLFVGASLEGIEAYLRGISIPRDIARSRRHYALVAVTDNAWRAKAEVLERRYAIKVLPYTPSNDHPELAAYLTELTTAVASQRIVHAGSTDKTSRLKRVTLENIGPFQRLTVDLNLNSEHAWHILLGDNGVGKSTVLKAIALALCGKDAENYAGRLIRNKKGVSLDGEATGTITLETDNKTSYVTSISRDRNGKIQLLSTTARPLEAEGWLAIGFPPLRTTSWEPPKGPEPGLPKKSRPVVSDLLPLVTGEVDPRLDKLKNWVVNLDYQDLKDKNSPGHYRKLIQKVFDIVGEVAEGMKLTYNGVDKENRIMLQTQDGTYIPLEGLSQGTISLIGWAGILMQRLYEVFSDDEDPTKRYALVLMDEIDAHMHPLWQRTLVNHLKKLFPNAQFIATTHSPLVVGGMSAEEVIRFARDEDGNAVILPIAPDMTLGYTDQVLTSLLFELPTTLDHTTEAKKKRFYELEQMSNLGDASDEYEKLKQELIVRVPPPAATYDDKHAQQLEEAEELMQLGLKLSKRSPEEGKILLDRANTLRQMLTGGSSND